LLEESTGRLHQKKKLKKKKKKFRREGKEGKERLFLSAFEGKGREEVTRIGSDRLGSAQKRKDCLPEGRRMLSRNSTEGGHIFLL